MAKRGFVGSWFASSQGSVKPHAHRKGKALRGTGLESKRKQQEQSKIHDPKSWGIGLPEPSSPPTILAPCTTRDPVDPRCRRLQRIRERLRTESLSSDLRERLQDIEEELSAELDM